MQAPRNLSQSLLQHLDEIASRTGGNVLLHGRLFAQWMHYAFPRECQYPHLSGTTTSIDPDAWSAQHGVPFRIDNVPGTRMEALTMSVEMLDREFAARHHSPVSHEGGNEDLMWTMDEETFVSPVPSLSKQLMSVMQSRKWSFGMLAVLFASFAAVAAKMNVVFSGRAHEMSEFLLV
jgi:hypothetical protein